jgi:hypothetical protein
LGTAGSSSDASPSSCRRARSRRSALGGAWEGRAARSALLPLPHHPAAAPDLAERAVVGEGVDKAVRAVRPRDAPRLRGGGGAGARGR